MKPAADAFERSYTEGVLDELPPPPAAARRAAAVRAVAPYALRGCVLLPDRAIEQGSVVISGETITAVVDGPADPGVRVVETDGVILPGLIDLHGHPEYNVFAAWEPPRLYPNRYAWRQSHEYAQVVKDPWAKLQSDPPLLTTQTRYAEVRALIGGVTAIQGASAKYPDKSEALVRNVDLNVFGQHKARAMIDLGRADDADTQRLRQQIDAGAVNAFYVHLAEGVDDRSRAELDALANAGLLTPATIIIHGTALTAAQLGQVKDAGAKMVWSPQSNLRLYGQTTAAGQALAMGITVGLGADWLPSGSPSLLEEMKVARAALRSQGVSIPAPKLVQMVTSGAAAIAGLDAHLGTLAAGRPADVLVLERRLADPWENVVEALPSWVELVTIGGMPLYGRADWVGALTGQPPREQVWAWGKQMALDTSYAALSSTSDPPKLADLRAALVGRYPQVGPVLA